MNANELKCFPAAKLEARLRGRAVAILAASVFVAAFQSEPLLERHVPPRATNAGIEHFLGEYIVLSSRENAGDAPLLVYLPGTEEAPLGAHAFLLTAQKSGYRVIGLEYDSVPAVQQKCRSDPDPTCAERFRQARIEPNHPSELVTDLPQETIVARLTALLTYLDRRYPGEHWGQYLAGETPDWHRIALAGHSQGAGMAAFIAKKYSVARVALLSGPWDFVPATQQLAPWLAAPSATPPDRWFAAFHVRERNAGLLARAYRALGLTPSHIRSLDLQPAINRAIDPTADLYHASVVIDRITPRTDRGAPAYLTDWGWLLRGASSGQNGGDQ